MVRSYNIGLINGLQDWVRSGIMMRLFSTFLQVIQLYLEETETAYYEIVRRTARDMAQRENLRKSESKTYCLLYESCKERGMGQV